MTRPDHTLQRTRHGVRVSNRCLPCAGSLSHSRMPHDLQTFLSEIRDLPEFVGLGDKVTGVFTRGLFDCTPLHVAAVRGDVHIIGLLLDAGAEIDVRGEHGYSPLHEAVEQGHIEAVRLLLQRGASVTVTNDDGYTPIQSAQILKEHEIERVLREHVA